MYNQRHKRIKKIILGQSAVALFITVIASSIIFYANGYRINIKNRSVYKVGIASLNFIDRPDTITIDGKEYKSVNNFYLGLRPGNYYIKAEKEGYKSWSNDFVIRSGFVSKSDGIVFFKDNTDKDATNNEEIIRNLNAPNNNLVNYDKNGLNFNEYEIWIGDRLITRYYNKISGVKWYPGDRYIAYQCLNEIRAVDINGKNDTLLINTGNANPKIFIFSGNGNELYYKDGLNNYVVSIR